MFCQVYHFQSFSKVINKTLRVKVYDHIYFYKFLLCTIFIFTTRITICSIGVPVFFKHLCICRRLNVIILVVFISSEVEVLKSMIDGIPSYSATIIHTPCYLIFIRIQAFHTLVHICYLFFANSFL